MKLAWRRTRRQEIARVDLAEVAEMPVVAPVLATIAESPAGACRASLDPALSWELRLLCRGLVGCTWSDRLGAATTDVHLPGDDASALALRALCWEIADEFELEQSMSRQGDAWIVRFSRRETGRAATEEEVEHSWVRAISPLFGVLAHPDETARPLHGPRFRGRAHPA